MSRSNRRSGRREKRIDSEAAKSSGRISRGRAWLRRTTRRSCVDSERHMAPRRAAVPVPPLIRRAKHAWPRNGIENWRRVSPLSAVVAAAPPPPPPQLGATPRNSRSATTFRAFADTSTLSPASPSVGRGRGRGKKRNGVKSVLTSMSSFPLDAILTTSRWRSGCPTWRFSAATCSARRGACYDPRGPRGLLPQHTHWEHNPYNPSVRGTRANWSRATRVAGLASRLRLRYSSLVVPVRSKRAASRELRRERPSPGERERERGALAMVGMRARVLLVARKPFLFRRRTPMTNDQRPTRALNRLADTRCLSLDTNFDETISRHARPAANFPSSPPSCRDCRACDVDRVRRRSNMCRFPSFLAPSCSLALSLVNRTPPRGSANAANGPSACLRLDRLDIDLCK